MPVVELKIESVALKKRNMGNCYTFIFACSLFHNYFVVRAIDNTLEHIKNIALFWSVKCWLVLMQAAIGKPIGVLD